MSTTTVTSSQTAKETLVAGETLDVPTNVLFAYSGGAEAVNWTGGGTVAVTVEGEITASSYGARGLDSDGKNTSGSLSVTVASGAGIVASDDAIRVDNNLTSGSVTVSNSGAIVSGTYNSSTGAITGTTSGQGIDLQDITSATTQVVITNYANAVIGAANSDAIHAGGTITVNNYGRIVAENGSNSAAGNKSDGVNLETSGGTVNNYASGTITGAHAGITGNIPVAGSTAITINNSGAITGQLGSGINIDLPDGTTSTAGFTTTTVINTSAGVIMGTAGVDSTNASIDGDGVDIDGVVSIQNAGTIQALGTSPGTLNEAVTVGGGTIVNTGTIYSTQRAITVDNSNLGNAYAPTTINNSGTINGGDGQAISITDTFADTITNSGIIDGSVTNGSGNDVFNAYTGSSVTGTIDGGAGTNTFNLDGTGTGTLQNVTDFEVLNVNSGSWQVGDAEGFSTGTTIAQGATLQIGSGGTTGSLTGPIIDNGALIFDRSDTVTVTNLTGSGSIEQSGSGDLDLTGTSSYSGGTIINGGRLELSASGAAGTSTITFAAGKNSTLALDQGVTPSSPISGFTSGDTLDLAGFDASSTKAQLNNATDILTITDAKGHSTSVTLSGNYSNDVFSAGTAADGADITESNSPVCFTPDVRIATANGEVAIKDLKIGDLVRTLSGEMLPVVWLGDQLVSGRGVERNNVLPIRIKAGALADNLPVRDLVVSPGHSLYFCGQLVRAFDLVNGVSVVRDQVSGTVHYCHIELERHSIIFAEGVPAETYLDTGNRGHFEKMDHAISIALFSKPCFPIIGPSPELTLIRTAIHDRLNEFGCTFESDPDIHLEVDGAVIYAHSQENGVYRFNIPASSRDLQLCSRSSIARDVIPSNNDHRQLGVAIERISVRSEGIYLEVSHEFPLLSEGFHETEPTHRWTHGRAKLPDVLVPPSIGPCVLTIHILSTVPYLKILQYIENCAPFRRAAG